MLFWKWRTRGRTACTISRYFICCLVSFNERKRGITQKTEEFRSAAAEIFWSRKENAVKCTRLRMRCNYNLGLLQACDTQVALGNTTDSRRNLESIYLGSVNVFCRGTHVDLSSVRREDSVSLSGSDSPRSQLMSFTLAPFHRRRFSPQSATNESKDAFHRDQWRPVTGRRLTGCTRDSRKDSTDRQTDSHESLSFRNSFVSWLIRWSLGCSRISRNSAEYVAC